MEKTKPISKSGIENDRSSTPTDPVLHTPPSQPLATPKTNEMQPGVPSSESELILPISKVSKISPFPRATRSSQNPEFAAKHRNFLNRVHDPIRNIDSETSEETSTPVSSKHKKEIKTKLSNSEIKRKRENDETLIPRNLAQEEAEDNEGGSSKRKKFKEPTKVVGGVDSYCWLCHRDGEVIRCGSCPRVFHYKKCLHLATAPLQGFQCQECSIINEAEKTDTRSRAMCMLTMDQLCNLLQFALKKMMSHAGAEEFMKPVDIGLFPNYRDYIVQPMDLSLLKKNIKDKKYGSTEAFIADACWIRHNSYIFNSAQSEFTNAARALIKIGLREMQEIENCPDCYLNANTRSSDSWFIEACRRPHVLVWAKLKSFPFWPAKAMGNKPGFVDVRFFGDHDRSWVPLSNCFLFSKLPPAPSTNKSKRSLEKCIQELETHVKKLRDKFGQFEYPPYRTPYDPNNEEAQLAMFLPMYEAKIPGKRSSRLSLHHDGARKSLTQSKSPSIVGTLASTSTPRNNDFPNSEISMESTYDNENDFILKESGINDCEDSITNEDTKDSPVKSPLSKMVNSSGTVLNSKQTCVSKTPIRRTKKKLVKKISLHCSSSGKLGKEMTHSKTSPKIPLTAAAKKCFATDKTCVRCKASNPNSTNENICSACSLSTPMIVTNEPVIQGKSCAHCHTSVTMSWSKSPNGLLLCSSCDADRLIKEKDKLTEEKTAVEKENNSVLLTGENLSNCMMGDPTNIIEPDSEQINDKGSPQPDGQESLLKDSVTINSMTANDGFGMELSAVDSPPKFIIHKICGNDQPNTSKKVSMVEKFLQEKNLCFAVEEAIKSHNNTVDENNTAKINDEDTIQETAESPVLGCDVEINQFSTAKIVETPKVTQNNEINCAEVEMETSSESSSEIDSEIEGDSVVFNLNSKEGNKKKKEKNINNVVQSLAERKNSVDETRESIHKNSNDKTSNPLMLDDSNDGNTALLINESGDSSNESKKPSCKPDKSRRKGIPAKVCNRSSTSTESITSSPESKSKDCSEVLDEVNGQFRRSSEDSDVTIMLVTENTTPQMNTPNQLRSVNISKSLSISVVNKPSADLVMECLDSDFDDQNNTDSSSNNFMLKATARKTFPSNPKVIDKCDSTKTAINQNKPNESHPPPLINLRDQTKVYAINKIKNGNPPAGPKTSATKPSIGPVSAKLEEVTEKMKEKFQSLFEEMLRECSEAGNLEATIASLKVEKERLIWRQRQEIAELKHNADLQISENRASSDADKQRALLDVKHRYEFEKEQAVSEAKRRQWCISCQNEALLYCCWNTSYCSVACQQLHWVNHMGSCSNKSHEDNTQRVGGNVEANRLCSTPRPSSGQLHEKVEGAGMGRRRKVRRCGQCDGCRTVPCRQCYGCTNPNSHSVCKNRRCSLIITKRKQWRLRPQDNRIPRLTLKPGYLPSNPQIMRRNEHLMGPPPAPPSYHQVFRPNQVYTFPQFNLQNRPPAIQHRHFAPFHQQF